MDGRKTEPARCVGCRSHDEVWNVGVADLATTTDAIESRFEDLEVLKDLEIAVKRAGGAVNGGVSKISRSSKAVDSEGAEEAVSFQVDSVAGRIRIKRYFRDYVRSDVGSSEGVGRRSHLAAGSAKGSAIEARANV